MITFLSCFIIFVSFLLYINSILCDFVFDDMSAIVKNKDVLGKSSLSNLLWNDYWGMDMSSETSHKSYRPFTVLTFRINHLIFGAEPWSYHFLNVLLNCLVCYLVLQLYITIVKLCFSQDSTKSVKDKKNNAIVYTSEDEQFIIVVAALLFTVHPIHTEAVTGVVGRAELLAAVFYILSIFCFLKFTSKFMVCSAISIIFAVLSKEQGITVVAVCIFLDIIIVNKLTLDDFCLLLVKSFYSPKKIKFKWLIFRTFFFIGFALTLLLIRYNLMNGELPHFTAFDNPASAASFPARHLTLNYLLPVNLWLLLNPSRLLCDWTMGTIPLVEHFNDARNLATLFFWIFYIIASLSVFFRDPISKLSSLSIAIATFSFLPASNLFFNVGFVVAERVLFLPSIGFCLLMSVGFWAVKKTLKCDRFIKVSISFILIVHSIKTIHRNTQWKSEETLFKSGLKVTQWNAKVWNNVGHVYESRQMWDEALKYFNQAVAVQPDDIGSQVNVARMYEKMGDEKKAELYYWRAKALFPQPIKGKIYQARVAPGNLQVFVKLANILKKTNRLEEADKLYVEAIRLRSTFFDAYLNRGEILIRLKRHQEAIMSYKQALQLTISNTNKSDCYYNMGVVYASYGNMTGALESYTYAIVYNPNNVPALFNSAVILEETRVPEFLSRAKTRVERVLKLEPENVQAFALMGSIHMDLGENNVAIQWWKKALRIDSTNRVCLFNLALIYSKAGDKEVEYVDAVQNLLHHYPNHSKGLLLYGNYLLNKRKNIEEAKRIYEKLKAIDPTNVEANHNYCVALVEERNLKGGEECLLEVFEMAPDVDYVQENLARVQRQLKLIEVQEREKEQKLKTNFKKVEPPAQEKESEESEPPSSNLPSNHEEEEEVIYVAQPIKKKQLDHVEEAMKIRDELLDNQHSDDIEENLERTMRAVEKLKEIKKSIEEKVEKKCPTNEKRKKSLSLKESALKVLDELESQIQ